MEVVLVVVISLLAAKVIIQGTNPHPRNHKMHNNRVNSDCQKLRRSAMQLLAAGYAGR